jgi:hypothetical protein
MQLLNTCCHIVSLTLICGTRALSLPFIGQISHITELSFLLKLSERISNFFVARTLEL